MHFILMTFCPVYFSSMNLEFFKTSDAMTCPVHVVKSKETVSTLAQLLLDTAHGGFPVVKCGTDFDDKLFLGLVTR